MKTGDFKQASLGFETQGASAFTPNKRVLLLCINMIPIRLKVYIPFYRNTREWKKGTRETSREWRGRKSISLLILTSRAPYSSEDLFQLQWEERLLRTMVGFNILLSHKRSYIKSSEICSNIITRQKDRLGLTTQPLIHDPSKKGHC